MFIGLALEVLHFFGINNSNLMNERERQKEGEKRRKWEKGGERGRKREGERRIRKEERGREYSLRNYPHIPISWPIN